MKISLVILTLAVVNHTAMGATVRPNIIVYHTTHLGHDAFDWFDLYFDEYHAPGIPEQPQIKWPYYARKKKGGVNR